MADKMTGKELRKPVLTAKQKRAEKREKVGANREIIRKPAKR